MKTVSKPCTIILGALLLAGVTSLPAYAADGPAPLAPLTLSSSETVSMAIPNAPTGLPGNPSLGNAANNPANNRAKITSLEGTITDSVKNTVKQLSTVDAVNLEDLNTARQVVAKLDLLIDIEKRLAELDKIHNDHSNEKSAVPPILASALAPPTILPSMPKIPHIESDMMGPSGHTDVSRISGAAGHYVATIQGKSVRVGDTLSGGDTVTAITAKDVTVKAKNGTTRHLKIKGVEQVYSNTL